MGALMDLKGAQLRLNMDMERRKNEWAYWSTTHKTYILCLKVVSFLEFLNIISLIFMVKFVSLQKSAVGRTTLLCIVKVDIFT